MASLSLPEVARAIGHVVGSVHWDVRDLTPASPEGTPSSSEADIETTEIGRLLEETSAGAEWLSAAEGERVVRELLRELGLAKSEGESRQDYLAARLESARTVLRVRADGPSA